MKNVKFVLFLLLSNCAGLERGCSSDIANYFSTDWIIVQRRVTDGQPYNCWLLHDASVTDEMFSDGVYWKDTTTGHLVHIAGQYARVQVTDGKFKDAAALIGVDADKCRGGKYPSDDAK